jgi:hypothetical protein
MPFSFKNKNLVLKKKIREVTHALTEEGGHELG